jgi:ribosomal protein S18 acetylase RimI-like enzyme
LFTLSAIQKGKAMDEKGYRLQTADDTDFLYQVYASTRCEEMARTGWDEGTIEQFLHFQFNLQHIQYHKNYPTASYYIIYIGDNRAGRLYVNRTSDEIRIIDISLLPEFRGKGLGTNILNDLITEAEVAGLSLRLSVMFNNPARYLYEQLGFSIIGEAGLYMAMERTASIVPKKGKALT